MFKFKEVSEQEYNDCAKGIINPETFHRKFYVLLRIFQVLDAPIQKWTYVAKATTLLYALATLTVLSFGLYHGIMICDIPFISEVGSYWIVIFYQLMILVCTKLNVSDYHQLQRIMREDFLFACTKGEKYRKKFFYNQIFTRKICKFTMAFITAVSIGMMAFGIFSLLFFMATHEPGEGKRPLLIPLWVFSVDLGVTPIYEIAFVYTCSCILITSINYNFTIVTEIIWIREIVIKADIIIWSIEDLMSGIRATEDKNERAYFDAILKQRLRDIVHHHQSMNILLKHFAQVYKKLLMFEQKLTAPGVCIGAYSCSVTYGDGEFDVALLLLLICAITLLFIPNYLCTVLSIKISSICYACWNTSFWNASTVIRPYLVLMMQRSLRPLPLTVQGFEEVSVQTFSKKMASAYSMFNMLRQVNI